ncbi:hypothetical protein [Aureimonas psammosilenae]|uniref:hypothetical protein n=1 Tax=Aureimonas psammosilenae TaxID=2495496 RepID=UPI001260C8AA|nr:hypothetical protein [Aureimonas psammosilenae]
MHHPSDTVAQSSDEPGWLTPAPGLSLLKRAATPVRQVQVFGQRCSGTNVLTKLIAANFGAETVTDRYGFKHWFVPEQVLFPSDVLVAVIARDPFDWVRSLYRQPWHAHPDVKALPFADFIRTEWHSYWDSEVGGIDRTHPMHNREMLHERDPATGRRFANPLRKRAAKLASWSDLSLRAHNLCLIDQDILANRPNDLLDMIGEALARPALGDCAVLETYKGNGFNRFVPKRYDPLSPEDARFIRSQLDPATERRFGFDIDRSA